MVFAGSLLLDGNLPCRVIDLPSWRFSTPPLSPNPGMATDDPALRAYREILDAGTTRHALHLPQLPAAFPCAAP